MRAQLQRVGERLPAAVELDRAGGIDRAAVVGGPVLADAVEVLEGEPNLVHDLVAGARAGVRVVLFEPLPGGPARRGRLGRRHQRRRRRQLTTQQTFVDPPAALGRMRAVGRAGHGQKARPGQQARPLPGVQRRRLQVGAHHALDPVDRRQRLVDEGAGCGQQRAQLPVAVEHDAGDEGPHLGGHGRLEVVLELRIEHRVLGPFGHLVQVQPLLGEGGHGLLAARVAQQPARLSLNLRLGAELAGRGRLEQHRVGHRAPDEVRQPRGHLVVVQLDHLPLDGGRARAELPVIKEGGRLQHALDHQADGAGVVEHQLGSAGRVQRHQPVDLLVRQRPAVGPQAKGAGELPGARVLGHAHRTGRQGRQLGFDRCGDGRGRVLDVLEVLGRHQAAPAEQELRLPVGAETVCLVARVAQQVADGVVVLAPGQPQQRHGTGRVRVGRPAAGRPAGRHHCAGVTGTRGRPRRRARPAARRRRARATSGPRRVGPFSDRTLAPESPCQNGQGGKGKELRDHCFGPLLGWC